MKHPECPKQLKEIFLDHPENALDLFKNLGMYYSEIDVEVRSFFARFLLMVSEISV